MSRPAPVAAGALARALAAAALAVLLAACAAQRARAPLPELSEAELAAAEAAQSRRAEQLRATPDWALTGRMAVAKGRNGGSGRIEWDERGPRYQVVVSAPVSRQSWRLVGGPDGLARLEGVEGGPREGLAEQVLREAVGWEIPVAPLRDWLRALPARAERPGAAAPELAYGADGRLRELRQHGWTIEYQDWHPAGAGRPEMPRRLEARHGDALVRLVVDEWRL